MRQITVDDMYLLSEIADKMDFKMPAYPKMPKDASQEDKNNIATNYGKDIITYIVRNIYKAKKEITKLIANVTEKNIEEVAVMPAPEFMKIIKDILSQDGVLDFFK